MKHPLSHVLKSMIGRIFFKTNTIANSSVPSSFLAYFLPPLECTKIFITSMESTVTGSTTGSHLFFLFDNSITETFTCL